MSRPPSPAPLSLRRGEEVEVVRWHNTPEGWRPETIAGKYAERTPTELVLVVDGSPRAFARGEWEICTP